MRKFWWILGAFIVVASIYFCLVPQQELPRAFNWNDKINHLAGHALLTLYFCGLVARRSWWQVFGYLLLMGVAIELAQHFMHLGRRGDVRDVYANTLGSVLGLVVARLGVDQWPRWLARLLGRRAAA